MIIMKTKDIKQEHTMACVIQDRQCKCQYGKTAYDSHVIKFVRNCMNGMSPTGRCVCGQGCQYPQ